MTHPPDLIFFWILLNEKIEGLDFGVVDGELKKEKKGRERKKVLVLGFVERDF